MDIFKESAMIQWTREMFESGVGYESIKKKGYYLNGDIYFMGYDDFVKLVLGCKLTEEEVKSMLKSQVIIAIEVS